MEPETFSIRQADVPGEHLRFENALAETRRQIISLQNQIRVAAGDDADIFDAHLLLLEDQSGESKPLDEVFPEFKKSKMLVSKERLANGYLLPLGSSRHLTLKG
jgi:phosphoenolpyruvate-protein kinase (PTS system EI component)